MKQDNLYTYTELLYDLLRNPDCECEIKVLKDEVCDSCKEIVENFNKIQKIDE